MTFEEILAKFDATRSGSGWAAHCPAHEDDCKSLSLNAGVDGKTVLHCHAGCDTRDVLEKCGLEMKDLFERRNGHAHHATINGFAAVYQYNDETGALVFEVCRKAEGDKKKFLQRHYVGGKTIWKMDGVRRVLYHLDRLQGQPIVCVAEGEKDVDRLWSLGIAATTNPMGAGSWRDEYADQLKAAGCSEVAILPDNDAPGREHAGAVARSCSAVGLAVWVVNLPGLPEKGDVSDYLDSHSADDFLRECREAKRLDPSLDAATAETPQTSGQPTVAPTSYAFVHAFPADHFVTRWITTFGTQCDAALEFHEAAALVVLAQVTSSLTAHISGSAEGLRTNLYILFIGDPGRTRKSTTKDFAVAALRRVVSRVLLPEQMTQESFVESLTHCNDGSALWTIDEFTDTLSRMLNAAHLAGMRGLLLELYARTSYTYRRVSKGAKKKQKEDDDGERLEDAFMVSNVTLSVIGCATPTLFQNLDNTAVGSGLLTRFAIVMPESKPPRLPQFELREDSIPTGLLNALHDIQRQMAGRRVNFAPGVLERLDDAIDRPLDEGEDRCRMTVRCGVMARKVAMLSAAGRTLEFRLADEPLMVSMEDAESAIRVVTRWIGYARAFEARTDETSFEVNVQRCVAIVKGRTVNRRVIAKQVHVPAKVMTEIEETLAQRGEIEVIEHRPKTGRPSYEWKWVG